MTDVNSSEESSIPKDNRGETLPGRPVGVVLAGGMSRRLGRDKTSLTLPMLQGATLLQWAGKRLAEVTSEWVVADAGRGRATDGSVSVPDGPGAGPAAGLLGAARHFPGRPLLALACDLPFVPSAVLARLVELDGDWVVPEGVSGLEPLCALYRPKALDLLERRVQEGRFSLRGLADDPALKIRRMNIETLAEYGPEGWSGAALWLNVNRPEDLERVESLANEAEQGQFLRLGSTNR